MVVVAFYFIGNWICQCQREGEDPSVWDRGRHCERENETDRLVPQFRARRASWANGEASSAQATQAIQAYAMATRLSETALLGLKEAAGGQHQPVEESSLMDSWDMNLPAYKLRLPFILLCTLVTKSFKQQFKWKSGVFSFLLYFSTPFLLFRCFSRLSDSGVNPYGRVCVREKTIMASAISGSYRCLIYLLSHFPNSIAWSIFGQLCIAAHTNTKQLLIH